MGTRAERSMKMTPLLLVCLCLVAVAVDGNKNNSPSCFRIAPPEKDCEKPQLDIQFLVESQKDILDPDVEKDVLAAVARFQSTLDKFETNAYLATFTLRDIPIPPSDDAVTIPPAFVFINTADALQDTLDLFLAVNRPKINNILMIFASGNADEGEPSFSAEVAKVIDAWDKVATILVVPSVATPNRAGLLELSNNKTANVLGATDAEISKAIEDAVTIPCETEKPDIDCGKCQGLALVRMVGGKEVPIPECDKDNTFKAKQCWKEECWCVKKDGEIIPDTKKNATGSLDCIAERAKVSKKVREPSACEKLKGNAYVDPRCDADGNFEPRQCLKAPVDGESPYCWCATSSGQVIRDTVHSPDIRHHNCLYYTQLRNPCKEGNEGTFPHPLRGDGFVQCNGKIAYSCHCPSDLVYNPESELCVTPIEEGDLEPEAPPASAPVAFAACKGNPEKIKAEAKAELEKCNSKCKRSRPKWLQGVACLASRFGCLLRYSATLSKANSACGRKGSSSNSKVGLIIGGVDAGHGEFPWQISLRVPYEPPFQILKGHICGGTLIGNQYVLSAAHCFYDKSDKLRKKNDFTVRVGEWHQNSNDGTEKDFAISEIHIHENYDPISVSNDIALIKLAKPVDFSSDYAGPACLPPAGKDYRGSQNCILSGWGYVNLNPRTIANRLQMVTGRIWGKEELLKKWGKTLPDDVVGLANLAFLPAWATLADPLSAPTVA